MHLYPAAPCATGAGAILPGFPFTSLQELDAHGVCEQIQATSAWTGVHLNLHPLRMLKSPRAFNAVLYDLEFMVRQALLAPARFTHPVGPSQLSAGVMQQRPAVVILHIVFFRGGRGSTMSGN